MRNYELTLVVDPELNTEDQKKLLGEIEKLITSLKGKVEEKNEWGKKELSYPIKRKTSGFYFHWQTQMPAERVAQLDQKIRRNAKIIRFLIVKSEKEAAAADGRAKKGGKNGAKIAK